MTAGVEGGHCGQCHARTSGPEVYKEANRTTHMQQAVSNTNFMPLFLLLPRPSSVMDCDLQGKINSFLPELVFQLLAQQ